MNPKDAKPHTRSWLLVILQGFLGIGALAGGGALAIDPSGGLLNMPLSMLKPSPFHDFLIPGLILMLVLGVVPLIIMTALIRKWECSLAEKLNPFKDRHWSWTFTLYTGFALIIWIGLEVYFIQSMVFIHVFYMALGLVIQAVTMLPGIQKLYERKAL